jgi:hypothetical protein
MGREVVGLTSLQYVFPDGTPPDQNFLTWYNKFEAVDKGIIKYAFVGDEPNKSRLLELVVAEADMHLEESTGDVYVIDVNSIPTVFYPKGNTFGGDLVVGEKFLSTETYL